MPLLARRPSGTKAVLWLSGLLVLVAVAGCERREGISRYTVDKPPPIEPLPGSPHGGAAETPPTGDPTDRTLGAIIPLGERGWFFKLSGPAEAVAAREEAFNAFVESVRFSDEGQPDWTLPDGWRRRPGNQIRYATLEIPSDGKPLEVSVTALPGSGGDPQGYILANVNRWRRQLRLPPIGAAQLETETKQVALDGATATLVNLLGHAAPDSMGRPPFFSGARDGN